jgi:hypothetical protein
MPNTESHNWKEEERRSPQRWRLDKTVSIPDVVSLVAALFAVFYTFWSLDTRVKLVEQTLNQIAVDQKRQDEDRGFMKQDIKGELRELNAKMDRLFILSHRPDKASK